MFSLLMAKPKQHSQVCCAGWMMYGQKTLWHCIHVWQPTMVIKYVLMYLPSTCINSPSSHQVACLFIYLHSNHLHSLGACLWYQVPTYLASYPGWGRGEGRRVWVSIVVHPKLCHNRFPMDGAVMGAMSHNAFIDHLKMNSEKNQVFMQNKAQRRNDIWLQADVRNSSFSHVVQTPEAHAQKELWSSLSV